MTSFATRRTASLARPPVDLRPLLTKAIHDQGPRPLCLPISISEAHSAALAHTATTPPKPLTPEPLWAYCVESGKVTPQGTTLAAVGSALAKLGQPPLEAWPYNLSLGIGTEKPPPATVPANWHKAQIIDLPLTHDGIEDFLEDALASSIPVVLVIEVTKEFENASPSGEISLPSLNSPLGDYHSILAVGIETNFRSALRRVLISNTWGDGWGAGGYGWLPLEYLIAFAAQAGIVDPASCKSVNSPHQT